MSSGGPATSLKKDDKEIKEDVDAAVVAGEYSIEVAASFGEYGILLVSFFYAWLSVLVVGSFLVVTRAAFLSAIPWFQDHLTFATDFANAILVVITALEDVVISIINFVESALSIFGYHGKHLKYHAFKTVSKRQVANELTVIASHCGRIDSTARIAEQFMPPLINLIGGEVCPYFRLLLPLPHGIGESLYKPFKAYVPDPSPWPTGNNCAVNSTNEVQYGILCGSIAIGYPILEILLPMVLIGLLILSSGSAIARLIDQLLKIAWTSIKFCKNVVMQVIHATKKIGNIICKPHISY